LDTPRQYFATFRSELFAIVQATDGPFGIEHYRRREHWSEQGTPSGFV
jgi:hypothetical protein